MPLKAPRVAVRGIIVNDDKVLLVNAWPDGRSDLMCAPGGGVEPGSPLPENLAREIYEETGLSVTVGAPCLVNEFHDPKTGFHQVEVFFRCTIIGSSQIDPEWADPERIVSKHVWATLRDLEALMVKPDSFAAVAFGSEISCAYDPLETIVM